MSRRLGCLQPPRFGLAAIVASGVWLLAFAVAVPPSQAEHSQTVVDRFEAETNPGPVGSNSSGEACIGGAVRVAGAVGSAVSITLTLPSGTSAVSVSARAGQDLGRTMSMAWDGAAFAQRSLATVDAANPCLAMTYPATANVTGSMAAGAHTLTIGRTAVAGTGSVWVDSVDVTIVSSTPGASTTTTTTAAPTTTTTAVVVPMNGAISQDGWATLAVLGSFGLGLVSGRAVWAVLA